MFKDFKCFFVLFHSMLVVYIHAILFKIEYMATYIQTNSYKKTQIISKSIRQGQALAFAEM